MVCPRLLPRVYRALCFRLSSPSLSLPSHAPFPPLPGSSREACFDEASMAVLQRSLHFTRQIPSSVVMASPSSSSSSLGCSWLPSSHAARADYSTAVQAAEAEVDELEKDNPPDDPATNIFKKMKHDLDLGVAPKRSLLPELLQLCHTAEHVELAFKVLRELRIENAVRRNQLENFSDEVALDLARACVRVGEARRALLSLRRRNEYGLTPTLATAHTLLAHGLETRDMRLVMDVYRAAIESGLRPSMRMAETVLRACEQMGDSSRLLRIGKEMLLNNVSLPAHLYDSLLTAAAALGRSKVGLGFAKWRCEKGVSPTVVSAVSTAKLHVLESDVEAAANELAAVSQEGEQSEELRMALTAMVEAWPQQLPRRADGGCLAVPLTDLKERLKALEETLRSRGLPLPVGVESAFGTALTAES